MWSLHAALGTNAIGDVIIFWCLFKSGNGKDNSATERTAWTYCFIRFLVQFLHSDEMNYKPNRLQVKMHVCNYRKMIQNSKLLRDLSDQAAKLKEQALKRSTCSRGQRSQTSTEFICSPTCGELCSAASSSRGFHSDGFIPAQPLNEPRGKTQ